MIYDHDAVEEARRVVAILAAKKLATVFPTEEALKKYLDEHPDADRSKHVVKEKDVNSEDGSEPKRVKVDKHVKDMFHGERPQHKVFQKLVDAIEEGKDVEPELVREGLDLLKNWLTYEAPASDKKEWREQRKVLMDMLKTGMLQKLASGIPEFRSIVVPFFKMADTCGDEYKNEDGTFKGKPGEAFDNCKKFMTECRDDVNDPEALCAWIGRKHGKIAAAPGSMASAMQIWFDGFILTVGGMFEDAVPRTELQLNIGRGAPLFATFNVSRWDRGPREDCTFTVSIDNDGTLSFHSNRGGHFYSERLAAYWTDRVRDVAGRFFKAVISECGWRV